jgi:hypothetical protein
MHCFAVYCDARRLESELAFDVVKPRHIVHRFGLNIKGRR